jgi:hypothetical protein
MRAEVRDRVAASRCMMIRDIERSHQIQQRGCFFCSRFSKRFTTYLIASSSRLHRGERYTLAIFPLIQMLSAAVSLFHVSALKCSSPAAQSIQCALRKFTTTDRLFEKFILITHEVGGFFYFFILCSECLWCKLVGREGISITLK